MAYSDQAALAVDETFRAKVRVGVVTAAVQVMGETQGTMSDVVFGKRQALAFDVLQSGGAEHLDRFVWAVVQNAAITTASTDSDIQFTVNSVWDDLAGVTEADGDTG